MEFKIDELIEVSGAQVLKSNQKNSNRDYRVSTDTRTIKACDIYLPLKGENFDGENFIINAIKSGASGYFTKNGIIEQNCDYIFKVEDTKGVYLKLANYCRRKINPITIAVTGSAGKTTTKEMIYSVANFGFRTHKTFSNHNNEIGFCQTLLSMPGDTQVLIVEMGMRGLGEIELISEHLEPNYALITNCGTAHIGRLGSLDNIAIAKCEIAKGLYSDGTFISLNQDIIKKHLNFSGEKIFYSLNDVKILEKQPSYTKFEYKDFVYEINVEGEYNVLNAIGAINIGLKLGMTFKDISKGLKSYHPIEKRWELEEVKGYKIINDSYNANPESMKASVKSFIELYPNPVVILGDMGELGENEDIYHTEVGEYLAKLNKNVKYILVGKLAKNIGNPLENKGIEVVYLDDNKSAACYIVENLNKNNTIFLKASRSMKFEQIIDNLKE